MYSNSYAASSMPAPETLLSVLLFFVIGLAFSIFLLVAWCKLFRKAGLPWERLFVPFYGSYWMYKVAGAQSIFWWMFACTAVMLGGVAPILALSSDQSIAPLVILAFVILMLVLYCIYCARLAKAYGKGGGFAFGLIILNPVFILILGFGSSEYQLNR